MNRQIYIKDPHETLEGKDDIAQCIYLILSTIPGSDPLRPDFGSDLYKYMDKPLTENRPAIVFCITEALEKWEKRIKVTRCRLNTDGTGKLEITLTAEMTGNHEQTTITVNV